jgi:hypothetical protein
MDPYRGGILLSIATASFKVLLYIAYILLKIRFAIKPKEETVAEPAHLIPPPDTPISSLKMAQALNPKTDPSSLAKLAINKDKYIRRALCRNPSLNRDDLTKLLSDPEPMVAAEANRVMSQSKIQIEEQSALN